MAKNLIEYHWDYTDNQEIINSSAMIKIASSALKDLNLTFDHVAIIFVDDEYLKNLHGKYLNDSSTTDVMTFDLRDDDSLDAEIYISVDTAKKVSSKINVTVQNELLRYMLHGILHLAGYNDIDEEERKIMKDEENLLVEKYNSKLN